MKFEEYDKIAITTLGDTYKIGDITAQMMGMILGLGGESGEVFEKFKKIMRDRDGKITDSDKAEIAKELGDILWYISATAHLLGYSLEEIARKNNDKLISRRERDQLHGSGDNR